MKIIADCGSTKCDWVILLENGKKIETKTIGCHPFFINKTQLKNEINKNKILNNFKDKIKKIYFYGSGCSDPRSKKIMFNYLKSIFVNAEITIKHDLIASIIAVYENIPSVICILGTGSNACYYDGGKIQQNKISIGYLLGDEASGCDIGKQFITNYLYGRLPDEINREFENSFNCTKEIILEKIYNLKRPNVYLASFCTFLYQFKNHTFVEEMINNRIELFLNIHVLTYSQIKKCKVNFTGSIAYYFKNNIKKTCEKLDLKLGNIVEKPISKIVSYHE